MRRRLGARDDTLEFTHLVLDHCVNLLTLFNEQPRDELPDGAWRDARSERFEAVLQVALHVERGCVAVAR
jgi:hypothetical protein